MRRLLLIAVMIVLLVCCTGPRRRIVVGCKNFTEQVVLGELIAQQIERKTGMPVERHFYLAGSYISHQALLSGRIDAYVEYTGTALTAILKQQPSGDRAEVYKRVKDEYARRFGVTVMPSLGFNNTFAMVIRGDDEQRLAIRTLSQAAKYAPRWRAGVGYEFMERPDGFKGLAATYGLKFAEPPRIMDLGLIYRALKEKQVDIVAGNSTDGLIAAMGFVVLDDDKHYFPPYEAVPLVRDEILQKYPAVASAIAELSGKVSEEEMRRLNYAVDGEHRDPKDVVADFLKNK